MDDAPAPRAEQDPDRAPPPVRRDALGRFPKGVSGNPSGGMQRATHCRKLAQAYAPRALKELFVILLTSEHTPSRVAAGKYIVDQAIGRPVQGLTLSAPDGGPVRLSPALLAELSDDELAALRSVAAKLVEHAAASTARGALAQGARTLDPAEDAIVVPTRSGEPDS